METREEFEALPDVAIIFEGLHPTIIWFCKTANRYATSFSGFDNKVVWLNGAWYAFQEQQEKIARLQSRIDGAMDFYNTAKSDVNIGMIRMAQYLKGEVK